MTTEIHGNHIVSLLQEHVESLHGLELATGDSLIASGLIESFEFINFLSVLESTFEIKLELDMLDFEYFETPDSIALMLNQMKERIAKGGAA
ncbi:hypothetical protein CSB45_01830 [candidate division KSB3 bacterium]|uniref:Carrier domain-containing protein n=1 Tax=candidate division KSB3 bacterium TaxID=2044937 RepID=A0A2G6EAS6_9BACT|nr:MAG: hypothetical protein CSB45_01830 [candidate division KSB3 bacterium]